MLRSRILMAARIWCGSARNVRCHFAGRSLLWAKAWCVKIDALKKTGRQKAIRKSQRPNGTDRQRLSCITSRRYAGLLDLYLKPGRKRSRLPVLKETYPDAVGSFTAWRSLPRCKQGADRGRLLHVFPQIYDCEGFFVARLRKTQAIPAFTHPKIQSNFPFSPVKDREAGQIPSGGCKCWFKLG